MKNMEFINIDTICKIEINAPYHALSVKKKWMYNPWHSGFTWIINRIRKRKEWMLQIEYDNESWVHEKFAIIEPCYTAEDWFYLSWYNDKGYYYENNNDGGIDVWHKYSVIVYYGSDSTILYSKTADGVIDIIESIFGKNSDKMRKFISPNAVKFDTTLYKYIYSDLEDDKK